MGFFDKLFTVTEDNESPQQDSTTQQPAQKQPSATLPPDHVSVATSTRLTQTKQQNPTVTVTPASSNATASVTLPPQPDMEVVKGLYQDLIDGNDYTTGSYLELKQNAEALSSMGLNDTQRFIAALKIMQAKNADLTKDDMLKSIDIFITKLNEIKSEALSQADEQHRIIKQKYENLMAHNNDVISKHQADIKRLQEEIDKHNQSIAEFAVDNDKAKEDEAKEISALMQQRDVFEQSVKYVETSLNNDKSVISAIN